MALTREQVFAVADGLDAAGQNPTLAAVRKGLGGGSFTTISEAMTEWKARKAAREAPARDPAPQAVTDRLGELGAELWALAVDLANGRLAAEREALEAARAQIEGEKAEAAELADQMAAELEDMKARLSHQEAAERQARAEADTLRGELAKASERVATTEARAAEIEKRADDLNAELARVNQQNAELIHALAERVKSPARKSGA